MRKQLIILVIVVSLLGLFIGGTLAVNQVRATFVSEGDSDTYLPIVARPQATPTLTPIPTPTPMSMEDVVHNNSFENGWETLPPIEDAGWLRNQRPNDWELTWLEPGEVLYDSSGDLAGGIPECIHKSPKELPPDEWLGGENALILEGDHTYDIFNSGAPFGAELRQEISGLTPGSYWRLIVPIQVHLPQEQPVGPYAAESGVWVNGQGQWANSAVMGDRQWYEHVVDFTVPADGRAVITIRVKSKWYNPVDFFIDFLH